MTTRVGGVGWHVEVAGQGPPLVLLHGFTGSAATWGRPPDWAGGHRTLAIDLIGHGASDAPADPACYTFESAVRDMLVVLDRLDVRRAGLVGYSLGARVALHLALAAPDRWSAVVLEGANPGLATATERAGRVAADERWAELIEVQGVTAFVDRWESQPLFATQGRLPAPAQEALRVQRLANRPAGLAGSLRGMGLGRQRWLLPRLRDIRSPALLIAGGLDTKFRSLAVEMAASWPGAAVAILPGAGHAVHLEQPAAFARVVRSFLRRHAGGSRRPHGRAT